MTKLDVVTTELVAKDLYIKPTPTLWTLMISIHQNNANILLRHKEALNTTQSD